MKRIFFAVALLAMAAACDTKHDGYTIKGTIAGTEDGQQVILKNYSKTAPVADTAVIANGSFEFTGKVSTPEYYAIQVGSKSMRLFVDNSAIQIAGQVDSLDKASVSGSVLGEKIAQMAALKQQLQEEFKAKYGYEEKRKEYGTLGAELKTAAGARKAEIEQRIAEIVKFFSDPELNAAAQVMQNEMEAVDSLFMAENPVSPYTVVLVREKSYQLSLTELAELVARFAAAPELAGNRLVEELQQMVATLESVQVGKQAPEITQNDPEGNPVSLSSVYAKNKITMIDFWASWCGPCRRFNPTLVKIYDKYHAKGFEIYATSFDQPDGREKWLKAIEDDKLAWIHVSDLKFWDNAAGKTYGIRGIPANVFVDQNGIIVARELGEEEMVQLLEERLK